MAPYSYNMVMMPAQTLDGEEWFDYSVKRYSDEFTEKGEASAVAKSKAIKKAIDEWNAVQLVTDMVPVESDTPSLIENAQKNGAKTMSLTARPIELIGVTQKQLRSMGIEFAKSTASNKVISMKGKGPSRFDGGILFAGPDNNKGDLLVDFLSKVKLKPKKVVFVDNKIHYVENVEKALAGMKIEYVGCRHGAADKKIAGFRREIADLQHKYFRQIMPDSTADTFLRIEAK